MRAHFLGLWIGLILVALAGCDEGENVNLVSGAPAAPPGSEQRTVVIGRAMLDVPLENASVELFLPDGTPIPGSQTTTDESGNFKATLPAGTASFRAVARKDGESYASEVEGFNPEAEMLTITPLTNIAAAYHQAHPELSRQEVEQDVRAYLDLPDDHDLRFHMVSHGHRPGFQVKNYLRAARAGVALQGTTGATTDTFVQSVVNSIGQVKNGIQVPEIDNNIFSDKNAKFWTTQGAQLGVAVVTTILQANGIPIGPLIGWAVNFALSSSGQTEQQQEYKALAEEIAQVAKLISDVYAALVDELRITSYTDRLASVVDVKSDVETYRKSYLNLLRDGSNKQAFESFATTVTDPSFIKFLEELHGKQFDSQSGLIDSLAGLVKLDGSFLSNLKQVNPMASEFNYVATYETVAINLIVEGFHGLRVPRPEDARFWYDNYLSNLALQAAKEPQFLGSDDVIYVRDSGRIFLKAVQKADTYGAAYYRGRVFRDGPYKNWRVASKDDFHCLVNPTTKDRLSVKELEEQGVDFRHARKFDGLTVVFCQDDNELTRGVSVESGDIPEILLQIWNDDVSQPYMLVCDAKDQEPSVQAALTTVKSIQVEQDGDQMKAIATVVGRQGKYDHFSNYEKTVDITKLVHWKSSNESALRIQNLPGSDKVSKKGLESVFPDVKLGPGAITWLTNGDSTVTATIYNPHAPGSDPVTGQKKLSNTNVGPRKLLQVRLYPKDLLFNTTVPQDLSVQGYYSDGTTSNLLQNLTFQSDSNQARVVTLPDRIQLNVTGQVPGNLVKLTVTTPEGLTDSTTVEVNL